jgi:pimeloyl-ACP methyl ester carboxylesterase
VTRASRKLAAIPFTDVVGYTTIVGTDEAAGVTAREKHRRLVQALVAQFHGTFVEETGDESMSTFPSSVDAVSCALALQGVLENDPELGLFAISAGGPAAIRYAAEHPDRITRLAFYGSFARMSGVPGLRERWRSVVPVVRLGWGEDNPAFRQMFTSQFMPDGNEAIWSAMNESFRISASAEDAANFISTLIDFDVTALAPRLRVPTLVIHARGDAIVTFEQGREIAARIPGARIHVLETNNHAFSPFERANEDFATAIRAFLAEDLP